MSRSRPAPQSGLQETQPNSAVTHWVAPELPAAVSLYGLDALVLGQGFVALGLSLLVTLWLLPKWLLLRATRQSGRATARWSVSLGLCAVAIMLTINFNNHLARQRAGELVSAINHYRAVAGAYPQALDDLVPVYIDAIPRAKYTLSFNRFEFANQNGRRYLAYAETPPFGRVFYDFGLHQWVVTD